MEKKEVRTVIIFPEELWKKAKNRALNERISLGELTRRSLTEYLDKKEPKRKGKDSLLRTFP